MPAEGQDRVVPGDLERRKLCPDLLNAGLPTLEFPLVAQRQTPVGRAAQLTIDDRIGAKDVDAEPCHGGLVVVLERRVRPNPGEVGVILDRGRPRNRAIVLFRHELVEGRDGPEQPVEITACKEHDVP